VLDAEEFRKAIRTFTTGITVITVPTGDDRGMHGMTAGSFASVSHKPQLVSINVAKAARAHAYMEKANLYTINLLKASQGHLADYFAGRLLGVSLSPEYCWEGEWPVLRESLGFFACRTWARYDGGDHSIFVGEVVKLVRTDEPPLVNSRGRFHALGDRIQHRFFHERKLHDEQLLKAMKGSS
jgi:flavin reductase (DIM6/NTAB) family NADH-FMN oxidoreductase RutF